MACQHVVAGGGLAGRRQIAGLITVAVFDTCRIPECPDFSFRLLEAELQRRPSRNSHGICDEG